ncbi:RAD55 family ATPase [Archaeoglobus profundus]|uniref:KaiC-like domain-containing protein n=1 Tax=Archaeoglobus profundus (strain DSM 5631 / JCM 9629 / NBRC 100127 / Av18) TaxID=572546 RepID=D2RH66_ARCPA|nr:hypothetical protein [Archaeoglobus profundus]ADB57641.1 hypothetical protein Arcpr_0576 [Archaeoglobus profundus DSM 5631]
MNFGIKKLDELIGDIEKGTVILIEGVGDVPILIAKEFLKNALNEGFNAFAIVSERVKRVLSDLNGLNVLTPDDAFSFQELFTISLVVRDLKEKVGLIDVFQQLLIMPESEKVYHLLREICQHIRKKKGIVVITLDKRLADDRTIAMFENEADYVIEIDEISEGLKIRRGIRVKKSLKNPPSPYYSLLIEGGIRVGDKIG